MMPRFFADMPKPQSGVWVACVVRVYAFGPPREVKAVKCNGLVRAYIMARILALSEDAVTPFYDGEVGINWAIRKP